MNLANYLINLSAFSIQYFSPVGLTLRKLVAMHSSGDSLTHKKNASIETYSKNMGKYIICCKLSEVWHVSHITVHVE